ncbi:MAG TPA: heavy metal-binding domain-containing protein [Planctomycetota bacterium]|nr:heavy metal-binding domain-containing protein [Planctomycetota bacterium]
MTTTPSLEGRPVKEYRGIVTGEAVAGGSMGDLGAALSNLGNTHDPLHERYLVEAEESALRKLEARAQELGAYSVLGVHLDYDTRSARAP